MKFAPHLIDKSASGKARDEVRPGQAPTGRDWHIKQFLAVACLFKRESVEKAGNGQELLDVPIAPRRRLTWADFVSSSKTLSEGPGGLS
jgi:hypothetical protein